MEINITTNYGRHTVDIVDENTTIKLYSLNEDESRDLATVFREAAEKLDPKED